MENKRISRLDGIQAQFDKLLDKTQATKDGGQSLGEIEGEILSELLKMGKLLLSERIEQEEAHLESAGYEVFGEKNQEASRSV
jgi:hypothetical protein